MSKQKINPMDATMNVGHITPKEIPTYLDISIASRNPVFLWGPPGSAKTFSVFQYGEKKGWQVIPFIASLISELEVRGLPAINLEEKVVEWITPKIFPTEGEGIFFLDELNTAPKGMMGALYGFIQTGVIGDYTMPEGWHRVAAGNRSGDKGVVHKMPTPLANRFSHYEIAPDPDSWIEWAIPNGIAPELVAVLNYKKTLIYAFDPSSADTAFPTYRTWHKASDDFKVIKGKKMGDKILVENMSSHVGRGAAMEVIGAMKIFNKLPNLDNILKNPTKAPIPEDPSILYAVSVGLSQRASKKTFPSIIKYIERIDEEFRTLTVKNSFKVDSSISDCPEFMTYAAELSKTIFTK